MAQKRKGEDENGKDPVFCNSPSIKGTVIGAMPGHHARLRRAMAPGLSTKSLLAQQDILQGHVDLLIRRLREASDGGRQSLDLCHWFSYFTFDVMGDLAFGEPFGCLRDASFHPWVATLIGFMEALLYVVVLQHYIPHFDQLASKLAPKKVIAAQEHHLELTRAKVGKRIALDTSRPDLIEAMLDSGKDGDEKLSRTEIEANAAILIVAGSETSASALTGITYYLCRHPQVLNRLNQEVRQAFQKEEDITFVRVGELRYLNAVISESMRVHSPVPWASSRLIRPGGDTIADHYVPGGVCAFPPPPPPPPPFPLPSFPFLLLFLGRRCGFC